MIIDDITNTSFYRCLGSTFAAAFDFLRNEHLSKLPAGRNEINGDQLFAMVVDGPTKPLDQCIWEAHRKYHDVQFVAEGIEKMGYANVEQMKVTEPYDPANDVTFFDGAGSMLTVPAGTFVVFSPQDVHMPSVAVSQPERVRKIVLKVAV